MSSCPLHGEHGRLQRGCQAAYSPLEVLSAAIAHRHERRSSSSASGPNRPRAMFQDIGSPLPRQGVHLAAAEWGGYSRWGGVAAETVFRQTQRSSQRQRAASERLQGDPRQPVSIRIQTETLTTPPARFRLPSNAVAAGPLPVPVGPRPPGRPHKFCVGSRPRSLRGSGSSSSRKRFRESPASAFSGIQPTSSIGPCGDKHKRRPSGCE